MRRSSTLITLLAVLFATSPPVRSRTIEFTDSAAPRQIRWPTNTITVAFSNSLNSPGPNIKQGSDVVGALRRALFRWSSVAKIKFMESSSIIQSISPGSGGDGVSLITVADTPENNSIFGGGVTTGKTRIFYDQVTGAIAEADIVINPHPVSAQGLPLQFSTDGSPGTYDLESTFTHELGHFLGLDHSAVVAATMQGRQGVNSVYNLPAFTERTLSEDDRSRIRHLYGPHENLGTIEGKILSNSPSGSLNPVSGAHVWAESVSSGRVIAGTTTLPGGNYHIESIPAGRYRVLVEDATGSLVSVESGSAQAIDYSNESRRASRSAEISKQLGVEAGTSSTLNFVFSTPQSSSRYLNPQFLGTNGDLSTMPVPVEAGKKLTLYVGGKGVDQVSSSGISIRSPFFTVDPASLTLQQFGAPFPVIGFEVAVSANAPFGDYSIRLQSNSGEVAYLVGGLTIDPGVNSALANADDDPRFFITQHYRDFLGREPDQAGLDYWVNELAQCGMDQDCLSRRRVTISAAFSMEREFLETGLFVYGLYKTAYNRAPSFAEFSADRRQLIWSSEVSAIKQKLAAAIIAQPEFSEKYPEGLSAEGFVDRLLSTLEQNSTIGLQSERNTLLKLYDGNLAGRAAIIRWVADNPAFIQAQYTRAAVLMQYFSYLRRDPDAQGYEFWLNALNNKLANNSAGYQSMACAFITSAEYQQRFGMVLTHSAGECGR